MLETLPIGKYIFWIFYWILFPVIFIVQIISAAESDLYSAIWKKEVLKVKILCSVKWIKLCNPKENPDLLNFSIRSHSKELVSFFLDRDFPVDQKNRSGKTALHIASEKGFCDIAEVLIQKGASVNAFGHKKNEKWPMLTPLHYAAWKGNICIIKKLINNGAGLSFLSESGFTPLHSAASAGKTSAAEVLLSAGADRSSVSDVEIKWKNAVALFSFYFNVSESTKTSNKI